MTTAADSVAFLNAFPGECALIDRSGTVLHINVEWNGPSIGESYLGGLPESLRLQISDVLKGTLHHYSVGSLSVRPLSASQFLVSKMESPARLQDRQSLLDMASRVSRVGGWSLDLTDNTLRWSDETALIHGELPGYSPPLGDGILYYAPEYRVGISQAVQDCLERGIPFDQEAEIITVQGKRLWVRAMGEAVRESDGRIRSLQGAFQDIGGIKAAEESVRTSEERFRLLARATNDAIWDWDLCAQSLWWNEGLETSFGYRAHEVGPGIDWWKERIHPEDRERVVSHRRQMLRHKGQSWVDEYRFARRDGDWAYVLDKGYVLRDGDGQPMRAIGGLTDQTQRRHDESALASSNMALQMLSRCNEALIRSENEEQLLSAVCHIAVETGGFRMAWVGFNNPENPQGVFPQTHADQEDGYLAKQRRNLTEGPFSRTIASGKPEVIADLSQDPGFAPWLALAHEHGYRGVICLPFHERKKTFGALLLYTDEVRHPSQEEVRLLAELADNIAFGILNLRAREERRRTFEAVEIISTGVLASTGSAFFEKLTYSMVKALGARAGSILRYDENRPEPTLLCSIADGKPSLESHPVLPTQDDVWVAFQNGDSYETVVGMVLIDSRGRALGQICVTFGTNLEQSEFVLATLRIFATRAVAELERQLADIVVREQASLLDKAQDAIIVHDLQGRVLYWNRSAQRVYGWDADEAGGRYVGQLLYHNDDPFQKACKATLANGEWQGEIEQFTKDGQPLIVEGRWTLVEDEHGLPKSVLSINTDITQRKKLEARFLQAQRMEGIGTLAGGIAHDLNNVLTPVIMSIELLRMKALDKDDEELLDTIQASAQRGADLVRQVLSFARGVEGTKVELNPAILMTDIQHVLRETLPKAVTFQCEAADSLWAICGDKTQIHQVLLNLCVNARDSMPDGGLLRIRLENVPSEEVVADVKPGPYICIQVSDTGIGVPASLRDRIFEPFFTTKELGRGTGLGLSTSLAIVKSHGGWIELSSEPHQGATFRVYLPALPEATPASPAVVEAPAPQRGNNELILVVDDEEAVRKVAQTTLERFGYRVILACNGAEGLEVYQESGDVISAVLTDMAMPVMDGPAMIVALKSMDPRVRIIASSGFTSNSSMVKATDAGIAHFIPKPYTAETMLKTLHEVLAES